MPSFTTMWTVIALFLLASVCSASLEAEEVEITIRLINGKNGKPITDENLNVFLAGSGFAKNYRADSNGLIKLHIDRGDSLEFSSNIQVTCHPYNGNDDGGRHLHRQFHVSDIIDHGVSDQNLCSKKVLVEPKPSEFIVLRTTSYVLGRHVSVTRVSLIRSPAPLLKTLILRM
jgi:hypothetical protein